MRTMYWMGAEDISLPLGQAPSVITTAGTFRAGFARCAVYRSSATTTASKGKPFPAGVLTSAWLTCRVFSGSSTNSKFLGFGLSGTENGFGVGSSGTANQVVLFKYDGTTRSVLATETGTSMSANATLHRLDMQVVNFGATATVNIYVDNVLIITWSGDLTVTGMTTGFDSFYLFAAGTANQWYVSEVGVSDTDTRSLQGIQAGALTGAGDANVWTAPTFTNINGTSFSDVSPTSSNVAAQDNEYNITDPTPAVYVPVAVQIVARCAVSSTPTATKIKFGYKATGGAGPSFGTGATKTPGAAYDTIEQLDATNPITAVAWAQSDMNGLQLAFESAS